jgi:hypothetical protein
LQEKFACKDDRLVGREDASLLWSVPEAIFGVAFLVLLAGLLLVQVQPWSPDGRQDG